MVLAIKRSCGAKVRSKTRLLLLHFSNLHASQWLYPRNGGHGRHKHWTRQGQWAFQTEGQLTEGHRVLWFLRFFRVGHVESIGADQRDRHVLHQWELQFHQAVFFSPSGMLDHDSFITWWVSMAKPTPALRHSSLLHPLQKSLTTANLSKLTFIRKRRFTKCCNVNVMVGKFSGHKCSSSFRLVCFDIV